MSEDREGLKKESDGNIDGQEGCTGAGGAAHFYDRTPTTSTFVVKVLKDMNKTLNNNNQIKLISKNDQDGV